jgi:mRNA-degrading endonuclease RelE of RelBE toxin-antitoxin system
VSARRRFSIEIAPTGFDSLRAVKNKKDLREIAEVIDGLAIDPHHKGKALVHPLEDIFSVRAARSRFRILYKVDAEERLVSVLLVGPRRPGEDVDVYQVARRLFEALGGGP